MAYQYKITVFTPTYNRAYIIEQLYQSLCPKKQRTGQPSRPVHTIHSEFRIQNSEFPCASRKPPAAVIPVPLRRRGPPPAPMAEGATPRDARML